MSPTIISNETSNDSFPVDRGVIIRGNFECEIPRFGSQLAFLETGRWITTNEFTIASSFEDEVKWRILIYPKGDTKENEDYISLFLSLVCSNQVEIRGLVRLSFLDNNNYKAISKDIEFGTKFSAAKFGFPKFADRETLRSSNHFYYEKLVIYCDVNAAARRNSESNFKQSECRLREDMSVLFADHKFSDAILSAQGKDFFVHKAILAARSTVFAAMFQHDMAEKKENRVDITDVDCDVLEEMLRYIYTGRSPSIEGVVEGLLAAANKYDLEILKEMCGKIICSKLTVENVADNLMLADLHNVEYLKARAIDFMIVHATEVITTSAFKNMAPIRPDLFSEVLLAFTANMRLTDKWSSWVWK